VERFEKAGFFQSFHSPRVWQVGSQHRNHIHNMPNYNHEPQGQKSVSYKPCGGRGDSFLYHNFVMVQFLHPGVLCWYNNNNNQLKKIILQTSYILNIWIDQNNNKSIFRILLWVLRVTCRVYSRMLCCDGPCGQKKPPDMMSSLRRSVGLYWRLAPLEHYVHYWGSHSRYKIFNSW